MRHGPFYPSSVQPGAGGAVGWEAIGNATGSPDGNAATATFDGEGVTGAINATRFAVSLPAGVAVKTVQFEIQPSPQSAGFNISDCGLLGSPATSSNIGDTGVYSDDDHDLTREDVTSESFGCFFSIYAQRGGQVSIESIALYVDAE